MVYALLDVIMGPIIDNPVAYLADKKTALVLFIIGAVSLVALFTVFGTIAVKRRKAKQRDEEKQDKEKEE